MGNLCSNDGDAEPPKIKPVQIVQYFSPEEIKMRKKIEQFFGKYEYDEKSTLQG